MRKLLLTCFAVFQVILAFGQVHVRGYTRKDGTYVKPHTRSYPSGHGSSGSSDLSSYSSQEAATILIDGNETSIPFSEFKDGYYRVNDRLSLYRPKSYDNSVVELRETELMITPMAESTKKRDKKNRISSVWGMVNVVQSPAKQDTSGVPVYMSVLRIDGQVVDIVGLGRDILYKDINLTQSVYHKFSKSLLSPERALELIDKYRFEASEGFLKRSIYSVNTHSELPTYMTHTIEVIRLR